MLPLLVVAAIFASQGHGTHGAGSAQRSLCGLGVASIPALQQQIAASLPGTGGDERFVTYSDEPNMRNWSFTTAAHPAHPAAACRTLVQREGAWHVLTEIECHSSRVNCDALRREYEQLDAAMRRSLNNER